MTDLTFVPTRVDVDYVCFIIDSCSRTIVGWRVATHMKTESVLVVCDGARSTGSRSCGSTEDEVAGFAETVNGDHRAEFVRGPEYPGPLRNHWRVGVGDPGMGPLA